MATDFVLLVLGVYVVNKVMHGILASTRWSKSLTSMPEHQTNDNIDRKIRSSALVGFKFPNPA